ncbi:MAG: hypothetical protein A2Z15_07650 [Chloroflexi bacterium RBG_16_50_11]|nr:MAG: hypothetical protein A2Z15_07650 [Chloroflexi bacterium RBG_16_50_11]
MSIVKKTIITVCCASLALLALVYSISVVICLKGFEDLEKQSLEKNIGRVTDALTARINALNTFCYDWAAWDDTYEFAQGYYQEYVDRNLQDETFTSSEINVIAILNASGEMVIGKAYDLVNLREMVLPDDFQNTLLSYGLINPPDRQYGIAGILLIEGRPVMVASRQILTSVAEGPSTGTIIMGRFLDEGVINSLAETTHLSISMISISDAYTSPVLVEITASLNDAQPIYVQTQGSDTITGYTFVQEIKGNPAFLFYVDMPRDIYAEGIRVITLLHLSLLIVGIVFCVLFVLLIKRIMLTRFSALSKSVSKIGSSGDLSNRISVEGKDEISKLATNINSMLESLEKSETRRRSQKELIGYIVANIPNAVLAINELENIVLANGAFNRMFSLNGKDIVGTQFANLAELGSLVPEIRAFLDSGSLHARKELQYKYNGFSKTLVANFACMTQEKLFFIILVDISEERIKQERLYLTDRLASVGEMASGIAHELNNPLTSVIALSEMLAVQDVPEAMREDILAINSEAKRAAVVVKNMLSFARRHSPQKQLASINSIIEDVLKLRTHEHKVTNINIVCKMTADLPEIMVDLFQIQQVFINIILNAEQAMIEAHGGGTLTIATERAGNKVRVLFTDDGPGIDPQYLHRIFDPFFTTKGVGKGTGLGLSISYGIVTAHNGLIYAKSKIGEGATFIVELPTQTAATGGR